MNSNSTRSRRWALRAAATCVAVSQVMVPLASIAQVPAANTLIKSTATASYTNGDGTSLLATSNTVQTTVQQVGSFTTSTGQTKSAAAGAPVAVPHTITNTGNGADTFTIQVQDAATGSPTFQSIDVFPDVDGDGQADSGAVSLLGGAVTNGSAKSSSAITIQSGASYSYVVVYTLPSAATTGWTNKGSVKVTATTTALYASGADISTVQDTLAYTSAAAFSATLAHKAPAVDPVGGGSWGSAPSSGERGTSTVYTLTYTNSGVAAGQIFLQDDLPAGLTYQTGTAVWSSNPGVPLSEAGAFGGPSNEIAFSVSGQQIQAMVKNVAPNSSGTISFKVTVGAAATLGAQVSNAKYSQSSCAVADFATAANGAGCVDGTTATTATFTVLATRGVIAGVVDTVAGTPSGATGDLLTMSTVVAGGAVKFTFPVTNNGNADDAFKLTADNTGASLSTGASTFPTGTVFTWFAADGVTPLQTSTGTGVDTGVIAAGVTTNFIMVATVPANTTVQNGANHTVKVTAVSAADTSKLDAIHLQVLNVVAGLVDVTSTLSGTANVDVGPGSNLNVVSQTMSITAGGSGYASSAAANNAAGNAVYDLYIRNYDTTSLAFTFDSSTTASFPGNLPAGYSVKYYAFNIDVATSVAGGGDHNDNGGAEQ